MSCPHSNRASSIARAATCADALLRNNGNETFGVGGRVNHSGVTLTTLARRSNASRSGAWVPARHLLTVAGETPTSDASCTWLRRRAASIWLCCFLWLPCLLPLLLVLFFFFFVFCF